MAKRCILDFLRLRLCSARRRRGHRMVTRVVSVHRPVRGVPPPGARRARPIVLGVAFINGTSAQGYELDDCHDQSMSHYGAGVIPSVMACSEGFRQRLEGKDMILAVVAGFELGTRIGNTVSLGAFHTGFHPCGLTSTFGVGRGDRQAHRARHRPIRLLSRPRRARRQPA